MTDEQVALVARALAHPARVRIAHLLSEQSECSGHEVFAGLPLAQSTISQHLATLKDAGLVRSRPIGTSMVYCLVPSVLEEYLEEIESIARRATRCVSGTGGC